MPLPDLLYDAAVRGVRLLSPLLSRGEGKAARALRGRDRAADRLVGWARQGRDAERPLLWLHAPSVGEGLQARAVLEGLRKAGEDPQVVFTHTSPSAEPLAARIGADAADYLPWDDPGTVRPLLDALRPDVVAFTKTEVWPGLVREAHRRGIASALVAGTLPTGAARLSGAAPWFLRPSFSRLARVAAVSEEDGARFRRLGVSPDRIRVTGDPGIDSAAVRVGAADPESSHLAPLLEAGGPLLVAGSTWPEDESVLLPALSGIRESVTGVRLVVAPHEPTPDHLEPLLAGLRARGWSVATLGEVESAGSLEGVDAVVVDRVGVLADLYRAARVAYVGGGFGTDGLHSVLEPAAAGVPVVFGPRHSNARAAGELVHAGAARAVPDGGGLGRALERWLGDAEAARRAGRAAAEYIRAHRGAAARTATLVAHLLHADPGSGHP